MDEAWCPRGDWFRQGEIPRSGIVASRRPISALRSAVSLRQTLGSRPFNLQAMRLVRRSLGEGGSSLCERSMVPRKGLVSPKRNPAMRHRRFAPPHLRSPLRGIASSNPGFSSLQSSRYSAWCPRRDSNPYTFRHGLLRPACLPIPPPGRVGKGKRYS